MEQLHIGGILEENHLCLFQRDSVQEGHQFPQHSPVLECRAQAGDIDGIGNPPQSAGQAAVDIGLHGIGDHQIRLVLPKQLPVPGKELQVLRRIDAPAVNGGVQKHTAHLLQRAHQIPVGQGQQHLMLPQKCPYQFPAEPVKANIKIGQDHDFHSIFLAGIPM